MPRYKITIEYDGTGFFGWQRQKTHISIQGEIERAIEALSGKFSTLYCSGRTDAGVHAIAQIAHFDMYKTLNAHSLMQGLNYFLSNHNISIIKAEIVNEDFHARFNSKKRHYLYRIVNRRSRLSLEKNRAWQIIPILDINAMREGAKYLIGEHNFSSFRGRNCQSPSPIKILEKIEIVEYPALAGNENKEIRLYLSAPSFLHHQVRNIVGTLSLVGRGIWNSEQVKIALEAKDRTKGGVKAPPQGLYFMSVDY